MSWSFLLWFGIAFVAYLVVMLIVAFIKRHKNKKNSDDVNEDK